MTDRKSKNELNEKRLTDFYEKRRGDISHWQTTPRKVRSPRSGPSSVFSIRLSPSELELVEGAANTAGTTLSGFIRDAAIRAASGMRGTQFVELRMTEVEESDVRSTLATFISLRG